MNKKIIKLSVITVIAVAAIAINITNKNNVTYAAGTTLAQIVMDKNPTGINTWESGVSGVYKVTYTKENGTKMGNDYRYIGANVNNYVSFNNDMYQIIGVFDENSHGKVGQQLVKLIRTRMLGAYSRGVHNDALKNGSYSNFSNNWTGKGKTTPANLNILLNEYFYNKTSTSDAYGSCIDWTYYYNTDVNKSNDCSALVFYGVNEHLRDYIETTTWYLNGYTDYKISKQNLYLSERGLLTGSGPALNADASTEAKIGLMYPSDYMYASGFFASDDTTTGDTRSYGNQNWMYKGSEWTITPRYNNEVSAYLVSNYSNIGYGSGVYIAYDFRPTFYLKQDVYVTGGDGSFDNPYTVACDTCSS